MPVVTDYWYYWSHIWLQGLVDADFSEWLQVLYIYIYLAITQKLRSSSGKISPTESGHKSVANA